MYRHFAIAVSFLILVVGESSAGTIGQDNFNGWTNTTWALGGEGGLQGTQSTLNTNFGDTQPGTAITWYGARFGSGSGILGHDIWVNGNPSNGHAKFEEDAGILFKVNATNLTNIKLSFDWRTEGVENADRFRVGFKSDSGLLSQFDSNGLAELGSSDPWSGWTEILAGQNGSWQTVSNMNLNAISGLGDVWIAFWLDNGEGDRGWVDNVSLTGDFSPQSPPPDAPVPPALCLVASGGLFSLLGMKVRRRRQQKVA